MVVAVAMAGVVALVAFVVDCQRPLKLAGLSQEMDKQLEKLVVPNLKLKGSSLEETLALMNQSIERSELRGKVRFALWTDPRPPRGFQRRRPGSYLGPSIPDANSYRVLFGPGQGRGSLTRDLSGFSMMEICRYVRGLEFCTIGQKGQTIYFVDEALIGGGTFEEIIEERFELESRDIKLTYSKFSGDPNSTEDFLKAIGVRFPYEGTGARYVEAKHLLIVRNVRSELSHFGMAYPSESIFDQAKRWFRAKFGGD